MDKFNLFLRYYKNKPYKRELAYLESTGTQYLLINKTITQNSNIEVKFQGVNTISGETPVVYGCNTINTRPYFWAGKGSGGNWRVFVAMGNLAQILETITQDSYNNNQHIIGNNGLIGYFDDTTYTFSATFSFNRICFFGSDNPNGPDQYPALLSKIRIFYIKCDELYLIPVLDYNNVPCMYDKVTKQLFYNQGTGQFNYV